VYYKCVVLLVWCSVDWWLKTRWARQWCINRLLIYIYWKRLICRHGSFHHVVPQVFHWRRSEQCGTDGSVSVEFKDPETKAASPRWLLCKAWAVGPSRDTQDLRAQVEPWWPRPGGFRLSISLFMRIFVIGLVSIRVSTPSIVDGVKSGRSQD